MRNNSTIIYTILNIEKCVVIFMIQKYFEKEILNVLF